MRNEGEKRGAPCCHPHAMMKLGRSPWPQWVWAEPCLAPPSCPQRRPPRLVSIPKFSLWELVCCWNWGNPAGPVPVSPPPVLRGRDQLFSSGSQAGGPLHRCPPHLSTGLSYGGTPSRPLPTSPSASTGKWLQKASPCGEGPGGAFEGF